jgi:hypothetical protein
MCTPKRQNAIPKSQSTSITQLSSPPHNTPQNPPNPIIQPPSTPILASALFLTPPALSVDGPHDFDAVAHMDDDAVVAHCARNKVLGSVLCGHPRG